MVGALNFIGIPVRKLFLLLLFGEEMLPKRLSDRARLPGLIHLHFVKARKLAKHLIANSQPKLNAHTIYAILLPVVVVAQHAAPQSLLHMLPLV